MASPQRAHSAFGIVSPLNGRRRLCHKRTHTNTNNRVRSITPGGHPRSGNRPKDYRECNSPTRHEKYLLCAVLPRRRIHHEQMNDDRVPYFLHYLVRTEPGSLATEGFMPIATNIILSKKVGSPGRSTLIWHLTLVLQSTSSKTTSRVYWYIGTLLHQGAGGGPDISITSHVKATSIKPDR